MLSMFFSKYGYKVDTVHSGEDAILMLKNTTINYSLITIDLFMPGMCGIQTYKKIQEFLKVPCIMMTSESDDTQTIIALEAGFDDYVTKPINPLVLLSRRQTKFAT